jgi:dCMP deaminase
VVNRKDLAFLRWTIDGAGHFSTCAKRQYMSIVTSPAGRVVGTGFNGAPPGIPHCIDGSCPRLHEDPPSGSHYSSCIAIHAEANALMWSDRTAREGGTLYVNGTPCWDCGKLIAGSGIRRLIHLEDPSYRDWQRVKALIVASGVTVISVEADEL